MNTTTKAVPAIACVIDGQLLKLNFATGEVVELDANKLSPEIREQAMMHGLKQKLVDAAAISRDPETGRSVTVEAKCEAVKAVYKRLQEGQWNKQREAGDGVSGGLLFRAMCKIMEGKKSPEFVKSWLEGKSDAEKVALRNQPQVKAAIDSLRPVAADTAGKGDELLADLLGEPAPATTKAMKPSKK